jgi:hypothetical protein
MNRIQSRLKNIEQTVAQLSPNGEALLARLENMTDEEGQKFIEQMTDEELEAVAAVPFPGLPDLRTVSDQVLTVLATAHLRLATAHLRVNPPDWDKLSDSDRALLERVGFRPAPHRKAALMITVNE